MISNFNIDFLIPAEVFVSRNGYLNPHQSVFYSVKFRRNKTRRTVVIAIDTKQLEASLPSEPGAFLKRLVPCCTFIDQKPAFIRFYGVHGVFFLPLPVVLA